MMTYPRSVMLPASLTKTLRSSQIQVHPRNCSSFEMTTEGRAAIPIVVEYKVASLHDI